MGSNTHTSDLKIKEVLRFLAAECNRGTYEQKANRMKFRLNELGFKIVRKDDE